MGNALTSAQLRAAYTWLREAPEVEPRYNIAPTDLLVVVGREHVRRLPWGLDGRAGGLFNLRSETALQPGMYQRLLMTGRAIVPASHFYEWRRAGSQRLPVAISRRDGAPVSLAAVVGYRDGAPAVTILTTRANADLGQFHDRMPVILSGEDIRRWVQEPLTLEQLTDLLMPAADGLLDVRPASPLVNSVRNDGPELLDPNVVPEFTQLELLP